MQVKEIHWNIDAETGTPFALARLVPTISGYEKKRRDRRPWRY
jgi:hypothetical protein